MALKKKKPFPLPALSAKEFSDLLIKLGACAEVRRWSKGMTLRKMWATCERGDWMKWLLYWAARHNVEGFPSLGKADEISAEWWGQSDRDPDSEICAFFRSRVEVTK